MKLDYTLKLSSTEIEALRYLKYQRKDYFNNIVKESNKLMSAYVFENYENEVTLELRAFVILEGSKVHYKHHSYFIDGRDNVTEHVKTVDACNRIIEDSELTRLNMVLEKDAILYNEVNCPVTDYFKYRDYLIHLKHRDGEQLVYIIALQDSNYAVLPNGEVLSIDEMLNRFPPILDSVKTGSEIKLNKSSSLKTLLNDETILSNVSKSNFSILVNSDGDEFNRPMQNYMSWNKVERDYIEGILGDERDAWLPIFKRYDVKGHCMNDIINMYNKCSCLDLTNAERLVFSIAVLSKKSNVEEHNIHKPNKNIFNLFKEVYKDVLDDKVLTILCCCIGPKSNIEDVGMYDSERYGVFIPLFKYLNKTYPDYRPLYLDARYLLYDGCPPISLTMVAYGYKLYNNLLFVYYTNKAKEFVDKCSSYSYKEHKFIKLFKTNTERNLGIYRFLVSLKLLEEKVFVEKEVNKVSYEVDEFYRVHEDSYKYLSDILPKSLYEKYDGNTEEEKIHEFIESYDCLSPKEV